jgi:hypothetical protein
MDRRDFFRLSLGASAGVALTAAAPRLASAHPGPVDQRRVSANIQAIPEGARKGVGLALGEQQGIKQLDSLNVDWFYTWGHDYPDVHLRPDFVPMIWGEGAMERGAVDDVVSELETTHARELLGFNEPDHPEQSAMSVASAINYWPELLASGLRLGSPSPAKVNGTWLRQFMGQAAKRKLRVDFVTMHSYPSPNATAFLNSVQNLHDDYRKPIWITEFAVADWDATPDSPSRYSEQQVMDFMRESVAGLRRMPFVERFAWKTRAEGDPVMGKSALFHKDGSLTRVGQLYRSL